MIEGVLIRFFVGDNEIEKRVYPVVPREGDLIEVIRTKALYQVEQVRWQVESDTRARRQEVHLHLRFIV